MGSSSLTAFSAHRRGHAVAVGVDARQESHRLVRHQARDRIQDLVGAVECGWRCSRVPSEVYSRPGASSGAPVSSCFFFRLVRFLDRPDLSFHHAKRVRALHANTETCLPVPVSKMFGFLSRVWLGSSYGVDEGTLGVFLLVAFSNFTAARYADDV